MRKQGKKKRLWELPGKGKRKIVEEGDTKENEALPSSPCGSSVCQQQWNFYLNSHYQRVWPIETCMAWLVLITKNQRVILGGGEFNRNVWII